jgi:hypothetical protein
MLVFYFIMATCFGALLGHHQAILEVSSSWLPSYIKVTLPVLEILNSRKDLVYVVRWKRVNNCDHTWKLYFLPCKMNEVRVLVCLWDSRLWAPCGYLQGDHAAGNQELRRCLQSFGRPLPTSKLELLSSTVWQIVRQILHRMWFGKWLAKRTGGFFVDRLVLNLELSVCAKSAHSFCVLFYCSSFREIYFIRTRFLDTR